MVCGAIIEGDRVTLSGDAHLWGFRRVRVILECMSFGVTSACRSVGLFERVFFRQLERHLGGG